MHHASINRSRRLRRVLAKLREFPGGLTTRQLVRRAHVCAVNSCVAELRAQGIRISCKRQGMLFRYQLA